MRIARRVRRVEAASERADVAALARWIAGRHDVTAEEVFAEARRLRDEAWAEGVAPEAIVARESGASVAEVRAEAARVAAEWSESGGWRMPRCCAWRGRWPRTTG